MGPGGSGGPAMGNGGQGYQEVMSREVQRTPLSEAYFGQTNMEYLKRRICQEIRQISGGKYNLTPESQSSEVLVTVMISIFRDNAHYTGDLKTQLQELNNLVTNDLVARTMQNIKLYLTYQRQTLNPMPMDRPNYPSSAGTKGLVMRDF